MLDTYFDELTDAWAEALELLADETNPERWHEPAAKLFPFAMFDSCRKPKSKAAAAAKAKAKKSQN